VRPSSHYLHIAQRYTGRRVLRGDEAAQRDDTRDCESDCGKEAKDILETHKRRMHCGMCDVSAEPSLSTSVGHEREKELLKVGVEM